MSDKGPPIPDLIGGGESYADRTYLDVSIEIEMYAAFSSKRAEIHVLVLRLLPRLISTSFPSDLSGRADFSNENRRCYNRLWQIYVSPPE